MNQFGFYLSEVVRTEEILSQYERTRKNKPIVLKLFYKHVLKLRLLWITVENINDRKPISKRFS